MSTISRCITEPFGVTQIRDSEILWDLRSISGRILWDRAEYERKQHILVQRISQVSQCPLAFLRKPSTIACLKTVTSFLATSKVTDLSEKVAAILKSSEDEQAIIYTFPDDKIISLSKVAVQQSTVLQRMLESGFREKGASKVHLPEDDSKDFLKLADCLHMKAMKESVSNQVSDDAVDLLFLADKYGVEWLKEQCIDHILSQLNSLILGPSVLCKFLDVGLALNIDKISTRCQQRILHLVRSDEDLAEVHAFLQSSPCKGLLGWCTYMQAADDDLRNDISLEGDAIKITFYLGDKDLATKVSCYKRLVQSCPEKDLIIACYGSKYDKNAATGVISLVQDVFQKNREISRLLYVTEYDQVDELLPQIPALLNTLKVYSSPEMAQLTAESLTKSLARFQSLAYLRLDFKLDTKEAELLASQIATLKNLRYLEVQPGELAQSLQKIVSKETELIILNHLWP